MTFKIKLLAGSAGLTLAVLGATPSFATGTTAGTVITNTANVNYTVGGVAQTQQSAVNTLTVDRKVIVAATVVDTAAVSVTPGQVNPVMVFSVVNSGNSVIDVDLAAAVQATATATNFSKTTSFLAGSSIVLHTGSATGPVVTYLDELAVDTPTTIYAVDTTAYVSGTPTSGAIPLATANGAFSGITLTATARQGGAAGSEGAVISTSTPYGGANNVFADVANTLATTGAVDAANNGVSIAADVFQVTAANLAITKTSTIISDPINGTTSPKAIPGATVRYCIQVANGAGAATATAPVVTDNLSTLPVTFVAGSIKINGSVTGAVCNWDGSAGGSYTAPTVSGTLADVAAATTKTLYFDVTIN